MKKIIGIAAIAALIATSAFAEIKVSSWNRSGMNFFNKVNTSTSTETKVAGTTSTDTETTSEDATIAATPSFANGSRIGLSFSGVSEDGNIGFNLNIDSNASTLGVGDQAKVWAKLGWFTTQFGKIQLDDLRGSIGDWGNRDIGAKGEDDVFDRFYPSLGMTMELRPVEGLFIGAAINSSTSVSTEATTTYTAVETYTDDSGTPGTTYYTKTETKAGTTSSSKMEDVLKAINVGAGYTIKDVAQIKAAYFGSAIEDYYGKLEFGADLLFLKGNTIELGAKLPMYASDKARATAFKGDYGYFTAKDGSYTVNSDGHYFDFCAGLSGSADKLSYKGHVYTQFGAVASTLQADTYISTPVIGLDAGVEYDLGVFTVGGTAKYNIAIYSDSKDSASSNMTTNDIGGELYAKKAIGGGYLFCGVADEILISSTEFVSDSNNSTKSTGFKNTFYIPVGIEIGF